MIYSTADLNFTADVNASAAHSHYCFSIRFSWTLIFNPKDDSHSLPFQLTNDTAVIAVNLSLQYLPESQSDQNRNRTVAVSDATATEIELHSSKDLLPATRYLFWLVVAAELSNGTYERLRSLTTIDLVTPLCNGRYHGYSAGSYTYGSDIHERVSIIVSVSFCDASLYSSEPVRYANWKYRNTIPNT